MRDPRNQPLPGDVLTRFGTTREVTALVHNERGTLTHVVYQHPAIDMPAKEASITSWRAFYCLNKGSV